MVMSKTNQDFSLGLNGPLYQFYLWTGLAKAPLQRYQRRIITICLFAWLPLLILSLLDGKALYGVSIPFLYDIDAHVRFLISLALLIYGEVIVHDRLKLIIQQFIKSKIIESKDINQFQQCIASATRLTQSISIEIGLLLFVLIAGHFISKESFPVDVSTWYATKINNQTQFTLPGYWYAFISLPLFQFLLLRWYYRMIIWYRFLWQVSRLPLKLNSLHPDRAGGLGFLEISIYSFEPFLLAHSALLAGIILNRIWNLGTYLATFQTEIISILVFLIILPLFPMIFFMSLLANVKREGTLEYDVVANHYVNDFQQKWIGHTTKEEKLLGTPDIQSLADLNTSFNTSNQMRILPFGRNSIFSIIILTALPLVPLIFTIMPLQNIIYQIISIVFNPS